MYNQNTGVLKVDEKITFQILTFIKNSLEEKIANAVGENQLLIDQKQLPVLFATLQNVVDACQMPVNRMLNEAVIVHVCNGGRCETKKRK